MCDSISRSSISSSSSFSIVECAPHHSSVMNITESDCCEPSINDDECDDQDYLLRNKDLEKTGLIVVGGGSFVRYKEKTSCFNNLNNIEESKYELLLEQLRILLVSNSYLYWIYYITMVAVCVVLLIWSIIQHTRPISSDNSKVYDLFLYVEGVISLILILEIFVKFAIVYHFNILSFLCYDMINWFDLIVSLFCIMGFISYLITHNRMDELIDASLIAFRFITQTCRIIILINNHRKAKLVNDHQFVDLSGKSSLPILEMPIFNENIEKDEDDILQQNLKYM